MSTHSKKAGVKRELFDTVKHEETREKEIIMNNARCTQARKTTHGMDGQHENV